MMYRDRRVGGFLKTTGRTQLALQQFTISWSRQPSERYTTAVLLCGDHTIHSVVNIDASSRSVNRGGMKPRLQPKQFLLVLGIAVLAAVLLRWLVSLSTKRSFDDRRTTESQSFPVQRTETLPIRSASSSSSVTDAWKSFGDPRYGMTFRYPARLGEVMDEGPNGYFLDVYEFTADQVGSWEHDYHIIGIYSNSSVARSECDGCDSPHFPLTVESRLREYPGFDCTPDFYNFLQRARDEGCRIVQIGNRKAFRVIEAGRPGMFSSTLSYIFFENGFWIEFRLNVLEWQWRDGKPFMPNGLPVRAVWHGKATDPRIENETSEFEAIVKSLTLSVR